MGELPEPWNSAAEKVAVRQTFRGIAEAAGVSHVTVRRLIAEGRTSQPTVAKIAKALRVEDAVIYEWAGVELSDWGPWVPPIEAHLLSPRARAALDELIRAITKGVSDGWMPEDQKSGRRPSVAVEDGITIQNSRRRPGPR